MQKESIKIGLLGFGTVGTGVVRIVQAHREKIMKNVGKSIEIKKILVRDIDKYKENKQLLTVEPRDILDDPDIDIVIEVMGSIDTAREYIKLALKAKKHVVTANKDLIALYGDELMALAKDNGCDLYYEASVGGGIPILRTLSNSMASDKIQKVMGIVNGTTNYMLTRMTKDNLTYAQALALAQEKGFAESDPTSDVEGLDAARKMVILTRLAFGVQLTLNDVQTSGITQIDKEDMQNAKSLGYTIKLLGVTEQVDNKVYTEVGPTLIPIQSPLSNVHDENNAVLVIGSAVGETMYYGPGAGELPTANSVVSDVINVGKNMMLGTTGNDFATYIAEKELLSKNDICFAYYYRINLADKPGMFLEMTKIFADVGASFDKIKQEQLDDQEASVMIITHPLSVAMHEQILDRLKHNQNMTLEISLKVLS